jgi:hypothetical protein
MTELDEAAAITSLVDKEAIANLKARYFRCMDCRDWSGMESVFVRDAVMDMRSEMSALAGMGMPVDPTGGLIEGRSRIIQSMSAALVGTRTVHHGHMGEIELLSPVTAEGVWAMEDVVQTPSEWGGFRLHGSGHYHEHYAKDDDGRWRISHLRLRRLSLSIDRR